MRIEEIAISNFRGIKNQTIVFDGKSTVFFGVNGTGKSTILRAINVMFSRIVQKIVLSRYKQTINMTKEDIRFAESKASIEVEISLANTNKKIKYKRSLEKKMNRLSYSQDSLNEIAELFEELYLSKEKANMPIFVNYGVHRVVLDIPLRIKRNHSFDKIAAFEKAIESKIDFRTFFEWFRNQEDYENEIKVNENHNYVDSSLQAVRNAIYKMLDGFSDIKIKRNPLRMTILKDDTTLEIGQLSDGEKCTIALIGDLARRLALANPEKKNPLEGSGIALIDEVELHMHPKWQRKIIPMLRETFPNIQFIITTHSPQVLGELDDNINVFLINQENNISTIEKIQSLIAWDSNLILEELMGTDSLNFKMKEKVRTLFEFIKDKKYSKAEELANSIDNLSHGTNPDVIKARVLIARGMKNHDKN